MSERRILFTIRESQNMPGELWERFTAKAADDGKSPVAALRQLIENYLQRPRHDATQSNPKTD